QHLSCSTNELVRIGIISCVKMLAEHFDFDHPFVDVTELDGAQQTFDAVDNFETPAVTEREDQNQSVISGGLFDGFMKLVLRALWKIGQPANLLKPNIFLD